MIKQKSHPKVVFSNVAGTRAMSNLFEEIQAILNIKFAISKITE